MFLEKLTIASSDGIIRDIPFNLRGLNLVLDTTPDLANKRTSGNNVGKTTFIRCIDFCLGSTGLDLYQDRELKNDNEFIKSFLHDKEVTFTLVMLSLRGERTVLQRSFVNEKDLYINGVQQSKLKHFKVELNKLLFDLNESDNSVSFRDIIKKFVRSDEFSANNILKILDNRKKGNVYWGLYLTLFGFSDHKLIKTKTELKNKLDKTNTVLKTVKGIHSLDQLIQKQTILQKEITDKEKEVKQFDLPVTYGNLIKDLSDIKDTTTTLSSEVSSLATKIMFNKKTRDELRRDQIHIDPIAIKQLYEEAKSLIPAVQKQFEEVLDFHQKMLSNKVKFIDQQIQKLEKERTNKKTELDRHLESQSNILRLLDNTGTFDDLIKVRNELDNLLREQGGVATQIEQIETLQKEIQELTDLVEENDKSFSNQKEQIKANIDIFNNFLIDYSEKTHGEKPFVYYNSEEEKFDISNLQNNAGKGWKKSDIIMFDLAFISFLIEVGLPFPRFSVHDELEIIHRNQVETIFQIANSLEGQLFISVLKDKIDFMGQDFIDKHKILSLSQTKKFFKLP